MELYETSAGVVSQSGAICTAVGSFAKDVESLVAKELQVRSEMHPSELSTGKRNINVFKMINVRPSCYTTEYCYSSVNHLCLTFFCVGIF